MIVKFQAKEHFNVTFKNTNNFSVKMAALYGSGLEPYIGPFTVTPNTETQTLNTADKRIKQNIIIKPIPSNYGLITWNGQIITVS